MPSCYLPSRSSSDTQHDSSFPTIEDIIIEEDVTYLSPNYIPFHVSSLDMNENKPSSDHFGNLGEKSRILRAIIEDFFSKALAYL